MNGSDTWGLLCGDGWSLLEGMVVCRQLGLGYAQGALSTGEKGFYYKGFYSVKKIEAHVTFNMS